MIPVTERIWLLVDRGPECWMWLGATHKGYGKYHNTTAHRAAYTFAKGPIPAGLQVDHLCRNPLCVRPDHLEAVTPAENIRRANAFVTHCKHGHPFDEANTYHHAGRRRCRACNRESVRRYSAAKESA